MKYLLIKIVSIGCLVSFMCVSCTKKIESKNDRPNILLIVSEDTSQNLGCYGNSIVHTPNLDWLAENGVRFSNAYTTNSICSPSRSSIFTGLYPYQNGHLGWSSQRYSLFDNIKVLPQYLKDAGYRTGIIGKIDVNPRERFNFDFITINNGNFKKQGLGRYAANAKKFIQASDSNEPFFLMVNFPDAHLPFQNEVEDLPSVKVDKNKIKNTLPFVGVNTVRLREETAKYYNCINRLDKSVGMLLDTIGDLSNTCIIYIGDHGAQFSRGKVTNYEGGLKVPFIIRWEEGISIRNVVRDELVSFVDILPTILDLADVSIPKELPGKSLMTLFEKNFTPGSWRKYLGAGGTGGSPVFYFPQRSLRGERYKIIHTIDVGRKESPAFVSYSNPDFGSGANPDEIELADQKIQNAYKTWRNPPEWELYDLKNDSWEFNNLAEDPAYKTILRKMQNAMIEWRHQTNDPFLDKRKLERFTLEMDSINELYPNHSYRNVENFNWKYPEYLNK